MDPHGSKTQVHTDPHKDDVYKKNTTAIVTVVGDKWCQSLVAMTVFLFLGTQHHSLAPFVANNCYNLSGIFLVNVVVVWIRMNLGL